MATRGRPCKLTVAERHELRRYREAGVSIARLSTERKLVPPDEEMDEWDADEELGCVDLEERLEAALDRAFGK